MRKLLQADTEGKSVLQLFGGLSDFGIRLDIDPTVRPDVIGDAWVPPFKRDSFDVVIIDPPYFRLNAQEKNALFRAAGWIAGPGDVVKLSLAFLFFFHFPFRLLGSQRGCSFLERFELLIVGRQGIFERIQGFFERFFVIHEDFFRRVCVQFLSHVSEQELRLGFRKPGFNCLTFEFLHETSINL